MSRIHRYPTRALLADYGRGVVGAGISGAFWALSPVAIYSMVLFGGLTCLFLLFVLRTAMRQRLRIESSDTGVGVAGCAPIAWRDLDDFRLRYYSVRRAKGRGWMTLSLRAGRRKLSLDSTLDGFDDIAAHAAGAARDRGLELNDTTLANMAALGLAAGGTAESGIAYGARG
jgi:hypothetical protein